MTHPLNFTVPSTALNGVDTRAANADVAEYKYVNGTSSVTEITPLEDMLL